MATVDLIIRSATTFYDQLQSDPFGRYRSWEHCYKTFHDARLNDSPDYDYLSLHLAFYLASWGMYRGSSFLLQKDYKVHIPVVNEILNRKYDVLFGIECDRLKQDDVIVLLDCIYSFLEKYYNNTRLTIKGDSVKNKLSSTLITKILMGTFGCVPAYDRYFISGVKDQGIATGCFSHNSLLSLIDFYKKNYVQLEYVRSRLSVYDLPYPQMKLLDMGFWQIGFEKDNNRNKIAH